VYEVQHLKSLESGAAFQRVKMFVRSAGTAVYNLAQNSEETVSGRFENLRPWKPGQSGNPGGRPKRRLIDEALEELLLGNDSELSLAIAKKLLARAKRGEVKAIQLVAERVQGKPKRNLEISGPGGGPLDIHNMTNEELNQRIAELMEKLKVSQ
jgi:Family of unknown function (DUF5681)